MQKSQEAYENGGMLHVFIDVAKIEDLKLLVTRTTRLKSYFFKNTNDKSNEKEN